MTNAQISGVGVGLRTPHIPHILENNPDIPWFELLADNWLAEGGLDTTLLCAICERYPVALHGVNLSLGSLDPLDYEYLKKIKKLIKQTNAAWYSEHCSFSSFNGNRTPDLLPLPYTLEAVEHISRRILDVQDFLGHNILIENVSCYVECKDNELSEAEFLQEILQRTGCQLLLDINNVYVNSVNHHFNPKTFLKSIPIDRVQQIHLGGHDQQPGFLLDTHGQRISPQVWELFMFFMNSAGPIPTLLEWDHDIPDWHTLMEEQQKAEHYLAHSIKNPIKDVAAQ